MEEKKTIFDYIGQVFLIFGITMGILNLFCRLFGESAKGYSMMFALGKEGVAVDTMLQFFLLSVCTVVLRFIFFTETLIKNMTVPLRVAIMLALEILAVISFIIIFRWFPVEEKIPWVLFFLCFGICFVCSASISVFKERMENKRMEEALERLKEKESGKGKG